MNLRECTKCGEKKPLDGFPRNVRGPDGRHWWCLTCQRESVKAWRQLNTEKARAGYRRDSQRSRKHVRRYGIEPIEYENMLIAQGGVCAICGKIGEQALAVDHCHKTGTVRGLLCKPCNWAMGRLGDDPELCERAARYLRGEDG